ncbi:MAG: hypothetical protein JXB39_10785 [Deltaproteobacteria bacterium]|nr:hypothetical protein [Deltaproteobacteria bacterium]
MTERTPTGADPGLVRHLRAEMERAAGRVYRIELEALGLTSLRAFQRLLQNLEAERMKAVRRAAMEPWRGW